MWNKREIESDVFQEFKKQYDKYNKLFEKKGVFILSDYYDSVNCFTDEKEIKKKTLELVEFIENESLKP